MRVKFIQPVHNGQRLIQPGWVLEVSDKDGQELISQGKAIQVSNRTACRKGTSDLYDGCRPIVPDMKVEQMEQADELPESMHVRHIFSTKKNKK